MSYYDYKKDYKQNSNYLGYKNEDSNEVVFIGAWIGILVLLAIPILNIIGLLIMAFGQINANIKNFAKAALLIMVISLIMVILLKGCLAWGRFKFIIFNLSLLLCIFATLNK